jgi:hypothetical protein
MHTHGNLAVLAILVAAAGFFACSGSSTPSNGTVGSGGSTSTKATGSGGANSSCRAEGTLTVTNQGMTAYLIDGIANPTLALCRGNTYTFAINAPGHPFYLKTVQSTGTGNAYGTGVTGNGAETGNLIFVVDATAPNTLFYDCSIHVAMAGTIHVVD